MKAPRYVIEGTWAGYRSSQDRVVHRSVHDGAEKKLRAWAERTFSIAYTDGTRLILSVRDCKPRERIDVRAGYMKLIRDCAFHDVDTVDALVEAEKALKARAREA
ncbi:hypothetical protein [Burkholderia pseudomultivorans]|uniref:hypothetical protein n=1 Tax=Burkholderia pseudomultivorans TaxID=1207504 RepID=UPI000841653C|nr:hypothetical protein [Burkholderia pseudomultivorans]AOI92082.1 hypothetical protein WS57_25560 [Burkholderia pseudomultivorans]